MSEVIYSKEMEATPKKQYKKQEKPFEEKDSILCEMADVIGTSSGAMTTNSAGCKTTSKKNKRKMGKASMKSPASTVLSTGGVEVSATNLKEGVTRKKSRVETKLTPRIPVLNYAYVAMHGLDSPAAPVKSKPASTENKKNVEAEKLQPANKNHMEALLVGQITIRTDSRKRGKLSGKKFSSGKAVSPRKPAQCPVSPTTSPTEKKKPSEKPSPESFVTVAAPKKSRQEISPPKKETLTETVPSDKNSVKCPSEIPSLKSSAVIVSSITVAVPKKAGQENSPPKKETLTETVPSDKNSVKCPSEIPSSKSSAVKVSSLTVAAPKKVGRQISPPKKETLTETVPSDKNSAKCSSEIPSSKSSAVNVSSITAAVPKKSGQEISLPKKEKLTKTVPSNKNSVKCPSEIPSSKYSVVKVSSVTVDAPKKARREIAPLKKESLTETVTSDKNSAKIPSKISSSKSPEDYFLVKISPPRKTAQCEETILKVTWPRKKVAHIEELDPIKTEFSDEPRPTVSDEMKKKLAVISYAAILASTSQQENSPTDKSLQMASIAKHTEPKCPKSGADGKAQKIPTTKNARRTRQNACVHYSEPFEPAGSTRIALRIEGGADSRRIEINDETMMLSKPPVVKNCYREHKEVARLTCDDVKRLRQKDDMDVSRAFQFDFGVVDLPNPVFKLTHCFGAYPALLNALKERGYRKPTALQSQAWPALLSGEDLIVAAQTGADRILAYLLPMLARIGHQNISPAAQLGPTALILVPTLDSAEYIQEVSKYYAYNGVKAVSVCHEDELQQHDKSLAVAISTPDHLLRLMQKNCIDVSGVSHLVIESAERIVDMGLEAEVRQIVKGVRQDRQTAIFSATLRIQKVLDLAKESSINAIQIEIGGINLSTEHNVKQVVEFIEHSTKLEEVKQYLEDAHNVDKVIIFCGSRPRAEKLYADLFAAGKTCICLHDDLNRVERDRAVTEFNMGKRNIMVATGGALRGLSFAEVSHVINMDMPQTMDEYVESACHTGGSSRTGVSMSFCTSRDVQTAKPLVRLLDAAQEVVPCELHNMAKRAGAKPRAHAVLRGAKEVRGNLN